MRFHATEYEVAASRRTQRFQPSGEVSGTECVEGDFLRNGILRQQNPNFRQCLPQPGGILLRRDDRHFQHGRGLSQHGDALHHAVHVMDRGRQTLLYVDDDEYAVGSIEQRHGKHSRTPVHRLPRGRMASHAFPSCV